jgi:hypothetical protein
VGMGCRTWSSTAHTGTFPANTPTAPLIDNDFILCVVSAVVGDQQPFAAISCLWHSVDSRVTPSPRFQQRRQQ